MVEESRRFPIKASKGRKGRNRQKKKSKKKVLRTRNTAGPGQCLRALFLQRGLRMFSPRLEEGGIQVSRVQGQNPKWEGPESKVGGARTKPGGA